MLQFCDSHSTRCRRVCTATPCDGEFPVPQSSKLLAWVESHRHQEFLAAYVGGAATKRRPATQLCASLDDARQWVEHEPAALGLTVAWVSEAPEGPGRFSR